MNYDKSLLCAKKEIYVEELNRTVPKDVDAE